VAEASKPYEMEKYRLVATFFDVPNPAAIIVGPDEVGSVVRHSFLIGKINRRVVAISQQEILAEERYEDWMGLGVVDTYRMKLGERTELVKSCYLDVDGKTELEKDSRINPR
jgi:hypothetical protein